MHDDRDEYRKDGNYIIDGNDGGLAI